MKKGLLLLVVAGLAVLLVAASINAGQKNDGIIEMKNEEAVEIAKLSLWLRTAKKGRKLSTLSNNIKCGNSLIDDPEVAGDKAFNWNEEFKEIMQNGGFDVVIGNPPYVRSSSLNVIEKKYFETNFFSPFKQYDIYILFYERSLFLLKKSHLLGFITPNKLYLADYGLKIRELLLSKTSIEKIADVSMMNVFPDASVYPTIIILKNLVTNKNKIEILSRVNNIDTLFGKGKNIFQQDFVNEKEFLINTNIGNRKLLKKVEADKVLIGDKFKISRGFRPPKDNLLRSKIGDNCFPFLIGSDMISAYSISWSGSIVDYIKTEIAESKSISTFLQPKILIRDIGLNFNAYYDEGKYLCLKSIYFIFNSDETQLKFLTALLNSKLLNFYFREKYFAMHISGGYLRFRKQFLEKIPIILYEECNTNEEITKQVNTIVELKKNLQKELTKFLNRIKDNFELEKISQKLQSFYEYDFKKFRAELKKQKVELTLKQQDEWEEYFNEYKTQINKLQEEITKTDNQIDVMVYKLYNLTYHEVKIVDPAFWMSEGEYNNFSIDKCLPIG